MECNEFRNIVADLFDKQVDEQLRTACEEHLRQCADCRSYYEGLRAAERVVRGLSPLPLQTLPQPLPIREGSNYSQVKEFQEAELSTPLPDREGLGESPQGQGKSLLGSALPLFS